MDKTFYKEKILELLENRENYVELQQNVDDATMRKIKRLTKDHADELTKNEIDYVQNFTSKTSNFYGLPKIHKSKIIKAAIKEQNSEYVKLPPPQDLKMRPIVAGPSSPTQRLSNFLDLILKPLCKHVASHIGDDLDFLSHIPEQVDENTILVSMDVVNLYTNIPHELGLKAIEYWLDNFTTTLERPFTKSFILKALLIILKENTFQFDDKNYRQKQGTAMGTKVAPTYATLVMGFLEQTLYEKYEQLYGPYEREKFVKEFKRFLDDCFIFWNKSEAQLQDFFTLLNNLHPKIQFTMESNTEQLPFLDILICKNKAEIYTDIYYKTTDSHQYLDFFSCHPKHTKLNIPFTLARRICTIVKKDNIREQRLQELTEFLRANNYPEGVITKGIQKAKELTIEELRSTKRKRNDNNVLSMVITHNPNNPPVINAVKEHLKFLSNSTKMKQLLNNTKLIVSRRQPQNLKRMLTKAAFSENPPKPEVTRCNEPRCGTCDIIITGDKITLKSGKTWHIKSPMSCTTKEVIYLIVCSSCGLSYVGQTNNLRNRVTLHRQQITHEQYRHLAVSKHIARCNGGNFKIMPILKCTGQSRVELECKEKRVISLLKPALNCDS